MGVLTEKTSGLGASDEHVSRAISPGFSRRVFPSIKTAASWYWHDICQYKRILYAGSMGCNIRALLWVQLLALVLATGAFDDSLPVAQMEAFSRKSTFSWTYYPPERAIVPAFSKSTAKRVAALDPSFLGKAGRPPVLVSAIDSHCSMFPRRLWPAILSTWSSRAWVHAVHRGCAVRAGVGQRTGHVQHPVCF